MQEMASPDCLIEVLSPYLPADFFMELAPCQTWYIYIYLHTNQHDAEATVES